MLKSSDILLFINIVTGVFSPCKTSPCNYLIFSVSQVRNRSVFTLKIIASKNDLVFICNSILEQICKTRCQFSKLFLANFLSINIGKDLGSIILIINSKNIKSTIHLCTNNRNMYALQKICNSGLVVSKADY